ncbi:hypothetical protein ONS95_006162 [Cadophora gregata]|uniref:uncharacterized protein n=1 Tax=Cadophora gregata TaxID=51156 RepID=UPI0026DD5C0D|nr:uncharacterized protein ONS95_006162 [Cadophora gregata]KAK0102553.1 hypothetical protein ONS95_006162 [Cadophora gregata]KAK0104178.1 hypothetical protein ONS96_005270 [Cadophora gregata f. sp. sojae]
MIGLFYFSLSQRWRRILTTSRFLLKTAQGGIDSTGSNLIPHKLQFGCCFRLQPKAKPSNHSRGMATPFPTDDQINMDHNLNSNPTALLIAQFANNAPTISITACQALVAGIVDENTKAEAESSSCVLTHASFCIDSSPSLPGFLI